MSDYNNVCLIIKKIINFPFIIKHYASVSNFIDFKAKNALKMASTALNTQKNLPKILYSIKRKGTSYMNNTPWLIFFGTNGIRFLCAELDHIKSDIN